MAPPTPCSARAAISTPMLGATAAKAEPTVKTPRPTMNMRLRPNRSPSAAPVRQQDGEGQRVGVHRPLEPLQCRAQVALDHRQRGGHDQVVQRDHEDADRP